MTLFGRKKTEPETLYKGGRWCAILLRSPKAKYGKGLICFLYDGDLMSAFWVITGSTQMDPKIISGIQPPIYWLIRENMERRNHPHRKRGAQTMSRITPLFEREAEDYPDRTFGWEGEGDYPFMGHAGSEREKSSTGCSACVKCFGGFMAYWNVMFYHAKKCGYQPVQMTRDLPMTAIRDEQKLTEALSVHFEEFVIDVWPERKEYYGIEEPTPEDSDNTLQSEPEQESLPSQDENTE